MYNRVGVIGNINSIMALKAVGVEVFNATSADQAIELVKKLSNGEFAVLFIEETLAQQIPDVLQKAKTKPYPAIVPIPSAKGATGFGMQGIKNDVEKAIGTDILFNTEETTNGR